MFNLKGRAFIDAIQSDIQNQPRWRANSAIAEAYYDSKQLPADIVELMAERGQPIIIVNLMNAAINGVLGNEAKTRRDVLVQSDDEEGAEVSEALNEKLNEAARVSLANRAIADAYARQIKAGIGWVEVRRNSDPFGDKYITEEIDWREMSWDWNAKRPDLKDARWVARERWYDQDQLLLMFPEHHEIIKRMFNDEDELNSLESLDDIHVDLLDASGVGDGYEINRSNWFNDDRKQVRVKQIYHRVYEKALVLIAADSVVKFDKSDQAQLQLLLSKQAKLQWADYAVMKCAWYVGNEAVYDGPSYYPHNELPWIPFWGYREGESRVPYGLAKLMMSAQDEYNFRRSVLTWILKARRIIMDDDATDMSKDQVREEAAKSDGVIILNSRRHNKESGSAFKIDTDLSVAGQQFQVMQDAKQLIQDVAGVYPAYLGQEGSGAKSGIAIASLVEQGSVTLSEINDNYSFGRQKVYELLLALIVEDIGEAEMSVVVNRNANLPTKRVVLNGRDKGNPQKITNSVSLTKSHVVLADIQSTPGYRAQSQERLSAATQSLPEGVQIALLPTMLDLMDLPNKQETIMAVKRQMNLPIDPNDLTEEELASYQEQQKEVAQMKQMEMEERQVILSLKKLELENMQAKTGKLNADSQLSGVRAGEILVDIRGKKQTQEFNDDDRSRNVMAEINQLFAQMPNVAQQATPN